MSGPSVFIGSSTEGLPFASAIRTQLEVDAEPTLWSEASYSPGLTIIEWLVGAIRRFDFAVLVMTPDDRVEKRGDERIAPRDNLLFELGLFMGRLGRERTFIVQPADYVAPGMSFPSDLLGILSLKYSWPRADQSHKAAVGSACDVIRKEIRDQGYSETKASRQIQAVAQKQEKQSKELEWIKFLTKMIVSRFEINHLEALAGDRPFRAIAKWGSTFEWEMRHLSTIGLVERLPDRGMRSLFDAGGEPDVKEHFRITDEGRRYLDYYQQTIATMDDLTKV